MRSRRLWTILCSLTLILGLAACGHKQAHPTVADANNDGGYIDAGPVTYQLQISRELNPYSTEDSQYLKGLPSGTTDAGPDQLWYGVFLWAKNQTHHDQTTVDNFKIVDTQGNTYYPVQLNSAAQSVRVDVGDARAQPGRARSQHDRQRRSDPGQAAAVQDEHHRLRQPAAHDVPARDQ